MESERKRGFVRRAATGVAWALFPVGVARSLRSQATSSARAVTGMMGSIAQSAARLGEGGADDADLPSEAEARVIVRNARTIWVIAIGMVLASIALAAMVPNVFSGRSFLFLAHGMLVACGLGVVGIILALDAARAVAEMQDRQPIDWLAFVRMPGRFIPW